MNVGTPAAIVPALAAESSTTPSTVQPITVSSTRADVHVTRLDDSRYPVAAVVHHRLLGMSGVEAVELLRALSAVLDDCAYCGQKCHGAFCDDADCERLFRGSETAIREGFESAPLGFAHTGRVAA